MTDNNIVQLKSATVAALSEVLKQGAQDEVADLLACYSAESIEGQPGVVRNGYLPQRPIQTGLGELPVKVPKVRDRSGQGVQFNSKLIPPYLKRSKALAEFIPWLY